MSRFSNKVLIFTAGIFCFMTDISSADEQKTPGVNTVKRYHVGQPVNDRQYWNILKKFGGGEKIIAEAEKVAAEPVPQTSDKLFLRFSTIGDRNEWQKVNYKRRSWINTYTLAECLENKGRFIKPLENLVSSICKEKTWVNPAHDPTLRNFREEAIDIDLNSSGFAWNLAASYRLLEDKLSAETRLLIRENLEKRIITPFRDMIEGRRKGNWWLYTTNNWNAVCLSGVLGTALAMADKPEDRAFFLNAALKYSRNFLKGFTPDGYCTEGLGYWNYGFGHYVLLADTVFKATDGKVDLLKGELVEAIANYANNLQVVKGIYPAYADCYVNAQPTPILMTYLSKKLNWQEQYSMKKYLPKGAVTNALIYAELTMGNSGKPKRAAETNLPLRSCFDDAGVYICRHAVKGKLAMSVKAGHNAEHHNHNDVGSYVIVYGGHALIQDPGLEVYTSRTFSNKRYESKVLNSWGHSLPVVAGVLQSPGRKAAGKVVKKSFSDSEDRLVVDLKSCYAVKSLKSLLRTVRFSREGSGSASIEDMVEFENPETFETAIITYAQIKKIADNEFEISEGCDAIRVVIDTGGKPFEVSHEIINENVRYDKKPARLGIRLTKPVSRASIKISVKPAS